MNEIRIEPVEPLSALKPSEKYICHFQITKQEIIDDQINRPEKLIDLKNLFKEINEKNNQLRLGR